MAYLAIRSQPDADVEDLVVVEEGEGEGAVHSPMSAVSNQKAPVLSNCKRIESESFFGNGIRFCPHCFLENEIRYLS